MEGQRIPLQGCPLVVMLAEHELARQFRRHIYKEDHILFTVAKDVIPAEQNASVWEEFDHVEHFETGEGVHEKYLALAKALEKEINT